jgi:hypothetical protein
MFFNNPYVAAPRKSAANLSPSVQNNSKSITPPPSRNQVHSSFLFYWFAPSQLGASPSCGPLLPNPCLEQAESLPENTRRTTAPRQERGKSISSLSLHILIILPMRPRPFLSANRVTHPTTKNEIPRTGNLSAERARLGRSSTN